MPRVCHDAKMSVPGGCQDMWLSVPYLCHTHGRGLAYVTPIHAYSITDCDIVGKIVGKFPEIFRSSLAMWVDICSNSIVGGGEPRTIPIVRPEIIPRFLKKQASMGCIWSINSIGLP